MPSSSAEPGVPPGRHGPLLGSSGRLVLGLVLLAAAVGAPMLGLAVANASARFAGTDTVTITISVAPTQAPSPQP